MNVCAVLALLSFAQPSPIVDAKSGKPPLDPSVYDSWNSLRGTALSNDGQWLTYAIAPQEGDAKAFVMNVNDGRTLEIPRGTGMQFTADSKFLVATVTPPFAESKKARRAKAKPEEMPKPGLAIVDLKTFSSRTVEKVTSFNLPSEAGSTLVYKPDVVKPAAAAPATTGEVTPRRRTRTRPDEDQQVAPAQKAPEASKKKADHKAGDPYVLLDLASGKEEKLENVSGLSLDKNGRVLVYASSTTDGKEDGVTLVDLTTKAKTSVVKGLGHYSKLTLSPDANSVAFLSDKDDYAAKKPVSQLFLFDRTKAKLESIGQAALPKGWVISENGSVSFSDQGSRLLYSTAPKPAADPEPTPDDEKVSLDVWTWQDPIIQSQQLMQAAAERNRSYEAVYDLKTGKAIQLETPELRDVRIAAKGDADVAIGQNNLPYRRESLWDGEKRDVYVVNMKTGTSKKALTAIDGAAATSPDGRYYAFYNDNDRALRVLDTSTLAVTQVAKDINVPIWDDEDDHPGAPGLLGFDGWTTDGRLLILDRYDIWSVDPAGKTSSVRLTNGRTSETRFRRVVLDPDEVRVDPTNLLLSAFRLDTKESGFYRLLKGALAKITMEPKAFPSIKKAKGADTMIYTRMDIAEYPDLWLTNTQFENPKKVTQTNPQQANYNWGTAEQVQWRSNDGELLRGILIKPENFDYGKKYPMITYFYERESDTLYNHRIPAPSASTINPIYFASNGYVVFMPDIKFKVGYPGESFLSSILPGIQSIVSRGYVDPKRLGVNGQSWGGYGVAYLVTHTSIFAAAETGAPVSNMFSAYGGIRYESGASRIGQYERGQSRIGETPWEGTLRYVENSPLFWVEKVTTPLMIMSNDQDGAVPHTQGIELFMALRRLNKPAWMVVYNGEQHNIMERKNRKDFSIRLSQFFDHFLKDAPMPEWMAKGIPATEKGRNIGLSLEKLSSK